MCLDRYKGLQTWKFEKKLNLQRWEIINVNHVEEEWNTFWEKWSKFVIIENWKKKFKIHEDMYVSVKPSKLSILNRLPKEEEVINYSCIFLFSFICVRHFGSLPIFYFQLWFASEIVRVQCASTGYHRCSVGPSYFSHLISETPSFFLYPVFFYK